jgi:ABC-2 type transport system permease protein
MSTTTPLAYGDKLDVSQTPHVPMSRLIKVELRKMVDTKAIGVITTAAVVIFGFAGNDGDKTFVNFMHFAGAPQGFLLPVLGILLVTQEWGQRTAMVTFTLEPHRGKVITAKIYASLILGAAALVVALVVASLATVVFGQSGGFDSLNGTEFLKFAVLQITGVVQGLAFGLLFLASAPAIVVSFVLPTAFTIISNVWSALHTAAPWIDLGTAQKPLLDVGGLTGEQWAQNGVAIVIWVVLPFAAGLWRVLRAELK